MSHSAWEHPIDPTPLHRAARHARIWRRFLIIALAREAQFRANAISTIVVGTAYIVVSLIPIVLLFEFTTDVKGWNRAEVIALSGLFQIVTGLMDTFVTANMNRFTGLVVDGELDPVLLRPMSSQFYTTFRWISPSSFFSTIAGILIMMFGLRMADVSPGAIDIAAAVVVTICGTVLLTCFCSAMIYLVFWTTSVHSISTLFTDLWYAGGYPTTFFPAGIRVFLTVVFPVAFATTVPMEMLLGRGSGVQVFFALGAAAVAILLIRVWWRFAVTFYSSASS